MEKKCRSTLEIKTLQFSCLQVGSGAPSVAYGNHEKDNMWGFCLICFGILQILEYLAFLLSCANETLLESEVLLGGALVRARFADDVEHALDIVEPFAELVVKISPLSGGEFAAESVSDEDGGGKVIKFGVEDAFGDGVEDERFSVVEGHIEGGRNLLIGDVGLFLGQGR